jgi:hypothetical protein
MVYHGVIKEVTYLELMDVNIYIYISQILCFDHWENKESSSSCLKGNF